MEKYVTRNITKGSACRYIHFLICHEMHWTLVVMILTMVVGSISI
ncbi:hypothetical protein CsSME_00035874 [Camellia sinensis var. sinensis]